MLAVADDDAGCDAGVVPQTLPQHTANQAKQKSSFSLVFVSRFVIFEMRKSIQAPTGAPPQKRHDENDYHHQQQQRNEKQHQHQHQGKQTEIGGDFKEEQNVTKH